MNRYRIHSPWLRGEESNGIALLTSAIEKLRETAVDKMVFTGDSIGDNKVAARNVVGRIHEENGNLILVAERSRIFAPPGKSNRIDDYSLSFCIRAEHDPHAGDGSYDVLENSQPYGKFIAVEHANLVDKDKCSGYLELI